MIEIIPNWHPVFIHFPIAFATAAVFLVALGSVFRTKPWANQCAIFGRWMLWAAAVFACIAAVFGWFAYNSVVHDDLGHLAMTNHRNWALAAVAALVLLAAWAMRSRKTVNPPSYVFLILLLAAWSLVISAAWRGGEVVYRHGLGVMSLPEAEEHHHIHGEEHGKLPLPDDVPLHEDAHSHHVHGSEAVANGEHPNNAGTPNSDKHPVSLDGAKNN